MKIQFHFITLFPETIRVWLTSSILGRAERAGIFAFQTYQLRDYSTDKHRSVDDIAYGGGGGMVFKIEPLVSAVEQIQTTHGKENTRVIYFSPAGKKLSQETVQEFRMKAESKHLILICGHYEGVDQRFIDHWVEEEISLGDFVLTGGELPALAFADALIRQFEGVLGNLKGKDEESFQLKEGRRLLEYPHYTRPQSFRGIEVPQVLLEGDHTKIKDWRTAQSLQRTQRIRPDLL